jgi:hypothetical protein
MRLLVLRVQNLCCRKGSVEKDDAMSVQVYWSICIIRNHPFFTLSDDSACYYGDELTSPAQAANEEDCEVDCSNGRE